MREQIKNIMDEKAERIDHLIEDIEYQKIGVKTTVCCVILKSGFEVIGTSACIKREDYNEEIGKAIALKRAVENIRPFANREEE